MIALFSLEPAFIAQFIDRSVDFGPIGEISYKRTYNRPEDIAYWHTVQRVVEGLFNHLRELRPFGYNFRKEQRAAQDMFVRMFNMKWLPPGRGMWAMGTELVRQRGSAYLNNCNFVTTGCDTYGEFISAATYAMDMLMCGVGVGFDTRGAGKFKVLPLKTQEVGLRHVVEDSKEGWCNALNELLMESFDPNGGYQVVFDYSEIRAKGSPLITSGGIAPGPEPLIKMINSCRKLLQDYEGRVIDSTFIMRLFTMIGACVVAGNMRRSAMIALGHPHDQAFISLKDDPARVAEWDLWASNNSIMPEVGYGYGRILPHLDLGGDPGVVWVDNFRFGRMGELKPDTAIGINPCGETCLESHELCNMAELFPARHDTLADFLRSAKQAYVYAKTVSLIPTHSGATNEVISRNRRLGISVSGIQQAIAKHGRTRFKWWLDETYKALRALDREYSDWLGVGESIRLTAVKPSGTISTLPGATSGLLKHRGKYMVKRIRISETKELWRRLQDSGYHVEDDVMAAATKVVTIPFKAQHYAGSMSEYSLWQQAKDAAMMAKYWADNAVSVTLTYSDEERAQLPAVLQYCERRLKSVSLLRADTTHYQQLPEEGINGSQYQEMMSKITEVKLDGQYQDQEEKFCTGEACSLETR